MNRLFGGYRLFLPDPCNLLASRELSDVSDEEILDALLASEDQSDFRARIESLRR